MKLLAFSAAASLLAFAACSANKPQFVGSMPLGSPPPTSPLKYSLQVDTHKLSFAVLDTPDVYFWQVKDIGDTSYLFAVNRFRKRLGVYNLDAPRIVWEVPFSGELGEALKNGKVKEISFLHMDTLVIHAESFLGLANAEGLFCKIDVYYYSEKGKLLPYLLGSHQIKPVWDTNRKGFWVQGRSGKYSPVKYPNQYWGTPIEVFIPVDSTVAWDTIPQAYPDRYSACRHGWVEQVQRCIGKKGVHAYSFAAESNLYVCDPISKEKKAYPARCTADSVPFPCLTQEQDLGRDTDIRARHMSTSPWYSSITYDPYRDVYYRIFSPALPEKDSSGYYNTLNEKKFVLMVLDNSFRLITEFELPDNLLAFQPPSVGKKGLYFVHRQRNTDEQKHSIYNFTFSAD